MRKKSARRDRSEEGSAGLVKDRKVEVRIGKFKEEASGMTYDESGLAEEAIAQSLDGQTEPAFGQAKDLEGLSEGISQ